MSKVDERDLKSEIADMRDRFGKLQDSELFVAWFLKCFVAENEAQAKAALVGGAGDKGLDAVLVDDASKRVFVVQGKYRQRLNDGLEHRADVISFAGLARDLTDAEAFATYSKGLETSAAGKALEARKRIVERGYHLQLYYVTTGRCSESMANEAAKVVRQSKARAGIDVIDGKRVLRLLADYLDGVAPPVPMLELEIESGNGVSLDGILQRFDGHTKITSWVFPVNVRHIAEMFDQAGVRLFARNVRGFLGETAINRNMEETLETEPEFFWYYNNGVTIVCDHAESSSSGGSKVMRIVNPQVINGQQTTRTLHKTVSKNSKATVMVRVISVPRDSDEDTARFDNLVSKIVAATNWQNAIRPSDLMSNDRRQIDLERNLRKRDYHYMRKRQTIGEAKLQSGVKHRHFIKKDELAQAVAACDLDPAVLREGKERLFEERYYSQVFPNSDPNYYLPRYWLALYVGSAARGYPERAYAKWVVTNFVWGLLSNTLNSRQRRELFIAANERYDWYALTRLCVATFKMVLKFYRKKRGTGEKATDVSTFFQRKALHREVEKFWKSGAGGTRKQVVSARDAYTKELLDWQEEM